MKKFGEKIISEFALKSLIKEVEATPKPGLVDRIDNGSHRDMNIETFYKSSEAIYTYFGKLYSIGIMTLSLENKLKIVREIGKEAENKMYIATDNVNTHKGIIFSLGLISFAVGLCEIEKENFGIKDILNKVKEISVNMSEEFNVNKPLTYGEKIYRKYGIKGIRGEAESGFKKAYEGLEEYYKAREKLDENDSLVHILFYFMSCVEDTNILGRKSMKDLVFVQECSKNVINLGGMKTNSGKKYIYDLNEIFIDKNISPGGSADYLIITYFLYLVNEHK